ncbi:MAG: hypothetical protein DMD30_12750 [Gemmatimonadetes bacterium]|nr:MAG: hypothetical protein DMD30_12750 [Gemmatimonadota bacterium]
MFSRECSITITLIALVACQSYRPPEKVSPRETLSSEQLELLRADSEVFAAVVHPLPEAGAAVDLYTRDSMRFDARPYGEPQLFRETAGGGRPYDAAKLFDRPDSAMMRRLTEARKRILAASGVHEGAGFFYPRCGGTLAPPPPPAPPGSTQTTSNRSARASGCPAVQETYLTVGIPVRGLSESLKKLNTRKGKPVDVSGDVWTVILDDHYAGPGGQSWFQHAWVLRRNPSTGQLAVAATILLAWAE